MFAQMRKCARWYYSNAARTRKLTTWLMNFMVMLDNLGADQVEEVLAKFVFPGSASVRIRSYKMKEKAVIRKLAGSKRLPPSEVYKLLEPLSHEVTLCMMAKTGSSKAKRRIRKFFTAYNGVQVKIKGEDIRKEGVIPGPRYKEILRQVLYEKLDGKLPDKRAEVAYMRKVIKESR